MSSSASCDEMPKLLPGLETNALASRVMLLEEFLAEDRAAAKTLQARLRPIAAKAYLHGHCHQKAFAAMGAVEAALRLVPDLVVETISASC